MNNQWQAHRLEMPKYVGQWSITPSFKISSEKRPNWLHRAMAKLLLGWTWNDTTP